MSGKRIEIVEPCVHGWEKEHWLNVDGSPIGGWQQGLDKTPCDGATRRTLTGGQYVLIEKVDGEWQWPEWINPLYWGDGAPVDVDEMLDYIAHALSDHTEGET